MKDHLLKLIQILNLPRIMAMSVLLLGTTLTSCEKGCGDEPIPGDSNCATEVTAESAGCATGAFQNLWLKRDNGEWLQPFENISNFSGIESGKRYRIGYEVMHRDSRYYPDPDRFLPDRWTPSFVEALPKHAYFPFGGGPRVCIGESFAWLELVNVVATIARRWDLELAPGHPVATQPLITLRAKHGMRMSVRTRTAGMGKP